MKRKDLYEVVARYSMPDCHQERKEYIRYYRGFDLNEAHRVANRLADKAEVENVRILVNGELHRLIV